MPSAGNKLEYKPSLKDLQKPVQLRETGGLGQVKGLAHVDCLEGIIMAPNMQAVLTPWVAQLKSKANLPVLLHWGEGPGLHLGDFSQPKVEIHVRKAGAIPLLLSPSLESLGQAYVEGLLDVKGRVEDLIDIAYRLAQAGVGSGGRGLARVMQRLRQGRHSKKSDSAAIAYHYDVSNEFYRCWLGPSMTYSCAYFENGNENLSLAQEKKIDHILTKLQLQPGQSLLDIGCGWGALVLRAASQFGAHCVGITLSQKQFEWAREQVRQSGLQDRVEIRLQDYRDVQGEFDRISSVGMFEHVGLKNLQAYFSCIRALLKDDGWVLNHGITSTDAHDGESPYGGGRFIDRYVFPQGELPHISTVLRSMQLGGLEATDVENLRRHYARTMACWSQGFEENAETLKTLVDEKRWRIWRIYLAGCQVAFDSDDVALFQVLCRKSGLRAQGQPWSRRWMYPH
jgi:cyclopropane-fatty-acyl-phospholipid synthase